MSVKRIYTEGVFSQLLKMFSFGLMRSQLDQLEKLDTDPEIQDSLTQLKQDTDRLESDMIRFCIENPDHHLCKESGKSRVTRITK